MENFKSEKKQFLNFGIYILTIAISGWFFYFLMSRVYRAYPFGEDAGFFKILRHLSDPVCWGEFGVTSLGQFLNNIKENIITGTIHVLGIIIQLTCYGKIITIFMFTCITGLFISLLFSLKNIASDLKKPLLYGVLLVIISLLGYTFRTPGMHYYSAALVSNIYLFLLLLFADKENKSRLRGITNFFLIILILCMFLYNGFSDKSVYWGREVRACSIYRRYDDLDKLSEGKPIYYLEYVEPYKDDPITSLRNHTYITKFYSNKFSHIHWQWSPASTEELYSLMKKEKDAIFFAGDSYRESLVKSKKRKIFVNKPETIRKYNYYQLSLISDNE